MNAGARSSVPARLDSLTSLRWFAATLVFVSHARELLLPKGTWFDRLAPQGNVGVSFFFILSGFVLVWAARPDTPATVFYGRRIARIYPAYAVVALVSVPLIYLFGEMHSPLHLVQAFLPLTLLQAWVPHYRITYSGNGVSWSLSCEAFFYLVFPFLVGPITRASRRTRFRLIVVMAAVPWVLALASRATEDQSARYLLIYTNPAARLPEFVIGMALAAMLRKGLRLPWLKVWHGVALVSVTYVIAGWAPLYLRSIPITVVPFALLIFAAAQADVLGATPRLLRTPLLLKLGAWSYCFYLVHQMVLRALAQIDGITTTQGIAVSVGAYVGGALLAGVVYTFVEHPAERRLRIVADRLGSRRQAVPAA